MVKCIRRFAKLLRGIQVSEEKIVNFRAFQNVVITDLDMSYAIRPDPDSYGLC